jgi:aryl-alcohol dehydrogenase-like predicted oxidoreductase
MTYGTVAGVDKPISRAVMGSMIFNLSEMPLTSAMLDHFVEVGGNCIDSAHIYAGGQSEQAIGHWMKSRGNREEIVVLTKGGATPHCNPGDITKQLMTSLERLQTDYIDIYVLHRDNLDLPVGELVEVLNEHHRAGRIRAFGGSNWSLDRVRAANGYAKAKGLVGFAAVSNNFSLARMVEPVWGGCIAASDPASREWFIQTQTALLPWSSQARGFFLPFATPDYQGDPELRRCWSSEDNFRRRERAVELADKRGVEPINIALAYVLHQPFPTFPLIGPRTINETRSSFNALNVALSPDEVKWLNLEG